MTKTRSGKTISTDKKELKKEVSSSTSQKDNHKFEYEFGGPLGSLGVIFGLPIVIYLLFFLCNDNYCFNFSTPFNILNFYNSIPNFSAFITNEAIFMYIGWMLFHIFLERTLPGESVEGVMLQNNKKLKYTMSGHLQFWVTLIIMGHAIPLITSTGTFNSFADILNGVYSISGFHSLPLDMIYDQYLPLISISIIFSFVLSCYL